MPPLATPPTPMLLTVDWPTVLPLGDEANGEEAADWPAEEVGGDLYVNGGQPGVVGDWLVLDLADGDCC